MTEFVTRGIALDTTLCFLTTLFLGKFTNCFIYLVYYFPPIFAIWKEKKSSVQNSQSGAFFNVYLPIVRTMQRFWIWKFLSPNYRKFTVECDRNSKISQIVRNLLFFLEKQKGFFERSLNVFKVAGGGKFAVKCVSNDIIS